MAEDTVIDPEELEAFERLKRSSVLQLLFKCGRLINERAVARLRVRSGWHKLRVAHTALFPHLDFEGIRLTQLAHRLGISKQAVGQLVDELEWMEVIERVPDPSDGRAKLIRFSRQGQVGLEAGVGFLREIEAELADALSPELVRALHEALMTLEQALDEGLLDDAEAP